MNWQILLAISLSCYALGLLLQRMLLRDQRSEPIAYSIIIQLMAGMLLGALAVIRGFNSTSLVPFLPNLILMVALYGMSNVFTYKALKLTEASKFTVIIASRACWTIAVAIILLKETFGPQKIFGTALIIFSVALASWNKQKIGFDKGELFALIAAFAFGIEFANDAYLLQHIDIWLYLPMIYILPALAVWMVHPNSSAKMKTIAGSKMILIMIPLACLFATSAFTVFLAYRSGKNIAQIASINETSTIVVVILAIIILKERTRVLYKLTAAVISVIGVALVR